MECKKREREGQRERERQTNRKKRKRQEAMVVWDSKRSSFFPEHR